MKHGPSVPAVLIAWGVLGCSEAPPNPPTQTLSSSASAVVTTPALQPVPVSPTEPTPIVNDDSEQAARAFARLIQAAEAADPNEWSNAEAELQRLGAAAIPALLPALRSAEPLRREMAVMFLAQLGPQSAPAANDLAGLLQDESPVVRVNAAAALTTLEQPYPQAVETLITLLDHHDVSIRLTAIACLGNVGSAASTAIPALEHCLNDAEPRIRQAAAQAVGQFGPSAQKLLPTLKLLSGDDDPAVRDAVTIAVQRIQSEETSPQARQ